MYNTYLISKATIIDSQGRNIITKSEALNSIDISNLSNGIYFLKVETENNLSAVKKLIKQ